MLCSKHQNKGERKIMIKSFQVLPLTLAIIDIGAALGYVPTGDWRKIIYWLAAATLTIVVTF
jgi:hypothetical protein